MYVKKLKIGNVELSNNLILAPMAGVTDKPFQEICKMYGNPGLICNEMVSSKALVYEDDKTLKMIECKDSVRPISMQIFGSDPECMGDATQKICQIADIVDINMGCPAPKVVKNGDGSRILLDLELAEKIIKSVVKNSTKPVTLKMRKGWDNDHIVATDLAKIAEKNGISAVTVHGRTRNEFYSGKADWDIIKKVKESVNIPVIGNGDVIDENSAKQMFEYTNCDCIMIGRGSLGNPWIFDRIKYFLENGDYKESISNSEKFDVMKEHFELLLQEKGEYTATREMRKHIAWYVKGMKNATQLREKINELETKEQFYKILSTYFN